MSWDEFNSISHYLCDYPAKYAEERPDDIALIDADDGRWVTWREFDNAIKMIALRLKDMGLKKGDIVVSMLPLLLEHIYFEYACFKLGVVFCPLDVRLKEQELVRCVQLLDPAAKVFLHADDTESDDRYNRKVFYPFKQYARAVKETCPFVEHFVQFSPVEDADRGTIGVLDFLKDAREDWLGHERDGTLEGRLAELESVAATVMEDDPILIIYTTGTTGFPKPAMLTNEGIVAQNLCLTKGFEMTAEDRMLVNLPPSHVGCQTEQLMSTIFIGGISVILHAFKADKTLQAIQDYKVTAFGQIPSLFVMEWRLPNYDQYDLSSLRFALYGGQAVSRRFLERMAAMAPNFGSGLGLTELSGFCSYTPFGGTVDDILASLGHDFEITPLTIRAPMKPDGSAGEELPDGEIGEVCYSGPQVFKGYYGNEEATRKTISTDGFCYTGDLGFKDEKGLHLTGRGKFVIKPKGYQVFPPEVEAHIEKLPEVALAAVVGAKHEVYSEGVVAFVQLRRGKSLTSRQVLEHCRSLAGYKRPSLVVFLDEIPLNRVDKTDYKQLYEVVDKYVDEERARGGWDAG
ncbi:MAG: class I adenylate-forming enzyme family protein [Promethearchaeota archaeon]